MTFEDFKEGFVAVLSLAIDNLSSSEDEAENTLESSGNEWVQLKHLGLKI